MFRCAQNGLERDATKEHIRSDLGLRSNEAQAIFGATLRAAVLLASRVVARSLQTAEGYARRSRLAGGQNPLLRNTSYMRDTTLKLRVAGRARKGNDIANVRHAREEH